MSESKPFIPRGKPRSWVVAVCAGLIGMVVGLLGFVFGWLGIKPVQALAVVLFIFCWPTVAVFMLIFAIRLFTGRYSNMQPRNWSEQIW